MIVTSTRVQTKEMRSETNKKSRNKTNNSKEETIKDILHLKNLFLQENIMATLLDFKGNKVLLFL